MHPRFFVFVTATAAGLLTLFVSVVPIAGFPYHSAALHVVLETTAALVAWLAAYLIFGRYRQSARLGDLLLVLALSILAYTSFAFALLPDVLEFDMAVFSTWASLAGGLIGASMLVVAAFVPDRRLRSPVGAAWIGFALATALLAATACAIALFDERLPPGIPAGVTPGSLARPLLLGHPALLAGQLVAVDLFAAAAIGFTRRAERSSDELMHWIAAGATLSAFARLNYFLFPSLSTEWIYTGDLFRLGFYLVLVAGAAREIGRYWRRLAEMSVLEERRRLARELHDGVAQELAFVAAEASGPIAAAAERALDESRRAIAALTRPVNEPLEVALVQAAEEVGSRVHTRLDLAVQPGVEVPPATREALIRIVREAVTNAARHGKAERVRIEITNGNGVLLRVTDDGSGFDPDAPREAGHLGLVSMRERAEAIGGEFRLESEPGRGTAIEVRLR